MGSEEAAVIPRRYGSQPQLFPVQSADVDQSEPSNGTVHECIALSKEARHSLCCGLRYHAHSSRVKLTDL